MSDERLPNERPPNERLPTFAEMGFSEMTRPARREEMSGLELQLPPISHARTYQRHVSPQGLGVMTDSGSAGQPRDMYPQPVEPWSFSQHAVASHHGHFPGARSPIEPSPGTSSSNSSAGSPTVPQSGFGHGTFRQAQTPSRPDSTSPYPHNVGQHFVPCDAPTQGYPVHTQWHPQNGDAAHTMPYWHPAPPDLTSVSRGPPPQGFDTWELYHEHRRQLALRNYMTQWHLEQESRQQALQQLPEHPRTPAPQP
ncbi:hypothetical protein V8F06_006552 [Rhypophila decipiens]